KCVKKLLAFTIAEVLIVLAILGVIAALYTASVMLYNPTEKNWQILSKKMATNFEDATTSILLNHTTLDDFQALVDGDDHFSINDNDSAKKMAKLYRKYLSDIQLNVDTSKDYFSKPLTDYDKTSLGIKLKDIYSEFFYVNDGILMGLRFYPDCESSEIYANPPLHKGKFQVDNICGSVFFDVNAYKEPNKLGSDQYIIPIYKRGIKYTNDEE
ncbi:prepilin-type N-terminal cleavage/methylation domain-containing protein, partial [bacterium]|nr:prepilin-type N-terminal cleavage/methylation domain-containing protein [bacterium]